MKKAKEFYILAGDKNMKDVLIKKGIEISPMYLMIVDENSTLGKLIKKEVSRRIEDSLGRKK